MVTKFGVKVASGKLDGVKFSQPAALRFFSREKPAYRFNPKYAAATPAIPKIINTVFMVVL